MPAFLTMRLTCDCTEGHTPHQVHADGHEQSVELEMKHVPSGPLKGQVYYEGREVAYAWKDGKQLKGRWLVGPFDPVYGPPKVLCPLHNPSFSVTP